MRTLIYTVFDKKSGSYSQPFFVNHQVHATRIVETAVNDPTSNLGTFPADFALYHLGHFDDQSGLFEPTAPSFVCELITLVYTPTLDNPSLFPEENK